MMRISGIRAWPVRVAFLALAFFPGCHKPGSVILTKEQAETWPQAAANSMKVHCPGLKPTGTELARCEQELRMKNPRELPWKGVAGAQAWGVPLLPCACPQQEKVTIPFPLPIPVHQSQPKPIAPDAEVVKPDLLKPDIRRPRKTTAPPLIPIKTRPDSGPVRLKPDSGPPKPYQPPI